MRLCVVLPVLDEEQIIAANCRQLVEFLRRHCADWAWVVIVADNGSTDRTAAIVRDLEIREPRLRYRSIDRTGKGYAIKGAWQAADADVYCFMDADLATDLAAVPALVAAIRDEGYDLAVGSRFAPGAVVRRDWLRRFVSRGYRFVLAALVPLRVQDAPCGFKAISRRVRDTLLPQVRHGGWFFDTELLVRAEAAGYRVKEIPVRWHEPPGRASKVNILSLSCSYLWAVLALRRQLRTENQGVRGKE